MDWEWNGFSFPSPGDLPDPEIKPGSPALQADSLPSEPSGKPQIDFTPIQNKNNKTEWMLFILSLQTSFGHSVPLEWGWISQCSLMQVSVRKFHFFRNSQAQIQACSDPQRSRHRFPDLKGHSSVTAKVHDLQLICNFPLPPSFWALHQLFLSLC